MNRYLITPLAAQDLLAIRKHVEETAGDAIAIMVLERIRKSLETLAEYPRMGHSRQDVTNKPVLFYSVFSYALVYDPIASPIRLIRVLHHKQDLKRTLRRTP